MMLAPPRKVAAILLAGGQSRRMGSDKSKLFFKNHTLLHHTYKTLEDSLVEHIFVSGPQKNAIPDLTQNTGPAKAVFDIICHEKLRQKFTDVIIMPVDMPLITSDLINQLITDTTPNQSGYFKHFILPAILNIEALFSQYSYTKTYTETDAKTSTKIKSDRFKHRPITDLLNMANAIPLTICPSMSHHFLNTNTPKQWQQVLTLSNPTLSSNLNSTPVTTV